MSSAPHQLTSSPAEVGTTAALGLSGFVVPALREKQPCRNLAASSLTSDMCFRWSPISLASPGATVITREPSTQDILPEVVGPRDDEAGHRENGARWIGSEAVEALIGGESFRLSWCFVGSWHADPDNPTIIDPVLDVAPSRQRLSAERKQFTSYAALPPDERHAYLEWISSGRRDPRAPRAFRLLFLSSLEHAIVRDGIPVALEAARAELTRLIELHADDELFCKAARRLLTLCQFIDRGFVPQPLCATAEANFRDEMPFAVRHFLGWMLNTGGRLEADAGLLFYLQQPHRRLDPIEAQYFRELHASWCLGFGRAAEGAFPEPGSLPRLALPYQPLIGDFEREFASNLPDIGHLPVPKSLEVLFRQCSEPVQRLRDEPVGRMVSILPVPSFSPDRESETYRGKVGAGSQLASMVPDLAPRVVPAAELVRTLIEGPEARANTLLPKPLVTQLNRIFDEEGFGFEPDPRWGLPPSLRLDRRVTVFRTGIAGPTAPTEAFLIAQAAVVASAAAGQWYPSLQSVALDGIEERLPYRHRFSDHEYKRLHATRIAIENLDERLRTFIGRWAKRLTRERRADQLVTGFGIAFKGQRGKIELTKLARALTLECPAVASVDELLAATSDAALPDSAFHKSLESRVSSLQQRPAPAASQPIDIVPPPPHVGREDVPDIAADAMTKINGLEPRHAELLVAVHDRARTRAELRELATARRLSVAGAVARINEWALLSLGETAIIEDEEFVISPGARHFLDELGVKR